MRIVFEIFIKQLKKCMILDKHVLCMILDKHVVCMFANCIILQLPLGIVHIDGL